MHVIYINFVPHIDNCTTASEINLAFNICLVTVQCVLPAAPLRIHFLCPTNRLPIPLPIHRVPDLPTCMLGRGEGGHNSSIRSQIIELPHQFRSQNISSDLQDLH